ncbi:Uncharacterised protein [Pseudomonas putida]|nr:Uncharacterised protein [Pseudomonas putida]CAB5628978.1 Uncharacterised protein [Pseudomonas putida]CAB5705759.1 Uncharacterised protein [Pseudomonas putida]CAB5719415.1 Uncharacterised protein [Pseudomonas putida]CAB5720687.1 Uncharacterised protein [Pseudomonas putida]
MIGSPIPDQRAQLLAQLNASIDNFFVHGGAVETLPSNDYVPHRPRREFEPERKVEPPVPKRVAKRLEQLDYLRQLAKTMTYAEAMAHTGLSQSALVRAVKQGGFKFQPHPNRGKGNLGKKLSDQVEDRAKAEQIVAYRNVGMKRVDVIRELQISYKQLSRILREFEIDFPTTAEKRAKRRA